MKIYVYCDLGKNWRWHVVATNKKKVATSGESFASRANAIRAAKSFVRSFIGAHMKNKLQFIVEGKQR